MQKCQREKYIFVLQEERFNGLYSGTYMGLEMRQQMPDRDMTSQIPWLVFCRHGIVYLHFIDSAAASIRSRKDRVVISGVAAV